MVRSDGNYNYKNAVKNQHREIYFLVVNSIEAMVNFFDWVYVYENHFLFTNVGHALRDDVDKVLNVGMVNYEIYLDIYILDIIFFVYLYDHNVHLID